MKSRIKKYVLSILCVALLALATAVLTFSFSPALAASSVDSVSFTVEKGAAVRKSAAYETAGLRYTITMPEADYDALLAEVGSGKAYEAVSFGVFIAPKETYFDVHPFNDETELNTYYYWDDDADKTGKEKLINIETNTLGVKDGTAYFYASVVDIKPENLLTEYMGVGYIKYIAGGETHYRFAAVNDNARSVVYVAQKAIEAGEIAANSDVAGYFLNDTVKATDANYAVEYYLEQPDRSFVKDETHSGSLTGKIGETVTAEVKNFNGYFFDANNENNVTSGTVYANDKLVLKRYYKLSLIEENEGIFDSKTTTSLDLTELLEDATEIKLYRESGTLVGELNGPEVDLTELDGKYYVSAVSGETTIRVWFEAYNSDAVPSWLVEPLTVSDVSVKGGAKDGVTLSVTSGALGKAGNIVKAENFARSLSLLIKPQHSKEYYETLKEGNRLVFDVYIKHTASSLNFPIVGCSSGVMRDTNKWLTLSTPLDAVVERWDSLVDPVQGGGAADGLISNWHENTTVELYVGNVRVMKNDDLTVRNDYYGLSAVNGYVTDTTSKIVDKDDDSYDLTELYNTNQSTFEAFDDYGTFAWALGAPDGTVTVLNGNSATFAEEGEYKLTGNMIAANGAVTEIYGGTISVFDSAAPLMWTEYEEGGAVAKMNNTVIEATVAENVKGNAGKFYKFQPTGANFSFTVFPTYMKAYYETKTDYSIVFDLYIDNSNATTPQTWFNTPVCGKGNVNRAANTWHTLAFTVESLFDSVSGGGTRWDLVTGRTGSGSSNGFLYTATNGDEHDFYIGNIRLIKTTDLTVKSSDNSFTATLNGTVTESETKLLDVNGKTSYDFIESLSQENKTAVEKFKDYGELKFMLTSSSGVETVLNGSVDLTALSEGVYTVNGVIYQGASRFTVYTCVYDLYSSTAAPKWIDSVDMKNVVVKKGNASYYDVTTTVVDQNGLPAKAQSNATDDSYYKVVNNPTVSGETTSYKNYMGLSVRAIHSKAYYQMLLDQADENETLYLQMQVFVDKSESNGNAYIYGLVYGSNVINNGVGDKWVIVKLSLSKIVELWDNLNGTAPDGAGNYLLSQYHPFQATWYVGDFQVVTEQTATE